MIRGRTVLAALVVASATAACGGGSAARVAGGGKVAPDAVPPAVLGLRTQEEDVSGPLREAGDNAYVSHVRLWSLREEDRLRGTLEVGRFSPDAPATEEFRRRVADQLGQSAPRIRRIGTDRVFVSAGNRQTYYLWFRGIHFVLLGVPADATNPRAVLRAAIETVDP